MIHLYYGDGKGKTTAAMGLVLRWVGGGGRAVVAQFLKSAGSGERLALEQLPRVTLLPVPERLPFLWEMTDRERQAAGDRCRALAERAERLWTPETLLVLDEVCVAVRSGLLPAETVDGLLRRLPRAEVVLTGRDPQPQWLRQADYVTEMRAVRHPYDRGCPARPGVEY